MYIFIICMIVLLAILFSWCFSAYFPCPCWLAWFVEHDNPFSKTNRALTIVQHANIQSHMIVLDAGCGPGRLSIPLAHAVGPHGHVVALDIQLGMLDRVRKKALEEGLTNITFLHAGIGEKRVEHNKFDRVLLVSVLGEVPNRGAALKEIFDALKPGGILSITEIITDPHFQSQKIIRQLACAHGFQEKNMFGNRFAFTINFEKPQ